MHAVIGHGRRCALLIFMHIVIVVIIKILAAGRTCSEKIADNCSRLSAGALMKYLFRRPPGERRRTSYVFFCSLLQICRLVHGLFAYVFLASVCVTQVYASIDNLYSLKTYYKRKRYNRKSYAIKMITFTSIMHQISSKKMLQDWSSNTLKCKQTEEQCKTSFSWEHVVEVQVIRGVIFGQSGMSNYPVI